MTEKTNINNQIADLTEVETLLESDKLEVAYGLIKTYWLEHPTDREAIRLMSKLMSKLHRSETAERLLKLSSSEKNIETDPTSLFQAAFALIDERQWELAIMLLRLCYKLASDQAIVSYELGFALMSHKHFQEAIPYLEEAYAKEKDFDTLLNLIVCYIHMRNIEKCDFYLSQASLFSLSDDQQAALTDQRTVIKRLVALDQTIGFSTRDWLYVKYGSVLLMQSESASGIFSAVWNDYEKIALTLLVLSKTIAALGLAFDVVEYYSTLSRPLAETMAQLLKIKADSYQGPREDKALLVMAWASDIIGPHESFIKQDGKRSIFAYGLTSLESLPLTPEIVGYVAESCAMPWDEHWEIEEYTDGRPSNVVHVPADTSDSAALIEKIMNEVRKLDSNSSINQQVSVLTDYYRNKKEFLTLNNAKSFPHRPEYQAEVST